MITVSNYMEVEGFDLNRKELELHGKVLIAWSLFTGFDLNTPNGTLPVPRTKPPPSAHHDRPPSVERGEAMENEAVLP